MKSTFTLALILAAALVAGPAQASGLYLTGNYNNSSTSNFASVGIDGDNNALSILQIFDNSGERNSLDVDITGSLDGGPLNAAFQGISAPANLLPGQLIQSGHANVMSFSVSGTQNLFAASQVGAHNMLTAMITGHNNQAAVAQSGSGNSLSFTQNGNGNRLTVIQRSY